MKSLLLFIAAATATNLVRGQEFLCDIPQSGCMNGMFNQVSCECECIPPFCHDMNGECADATKVCADPWSRCTRGVDCPWWANRQNSEACTTGPDVPPGLYNVYNTKSICCKANFPYSTTCDILPQTSAPTKFPTLMVVDDNFEIIPFSMDINGLPDDINCDLLWEEMEMITKRQLLRTAERIPELKISSVETRLGENCGESRTRRRLTQDVTLYFVVNAIRDDDKKFGPIIIQDFRDSKNEIISDIQSYADTELFGPGGDTLGINFCTTLSGEYNLCMLDKSTPSPVRAPTPVVIRADPDSGDSDGLAFWAIALIIIFILLLLCCIGYAVFVSCFKDYDENKEIHNNIYMDDNKSRASGYDDRVLAITDGRSQASGYDRVLAITDGRSQGSRTSRRSSQSRGQVILSGPQDTALEDDSFTINTYGTKHTKQRTVNTNRTSKTGRDPTMYIPGQEDRPDPDSSVRSVGSRRYYEDPPLKPKRDPTMYLEGQRDPTTYVKGQRDPTMYVEGQRDPTMYMDDYSAADPPLKPGRDPTMYEDGRIYVDEDTVEEVYNDDRGREKFGMGGIDEESEYDNFGFKQESSYASESMADYSRGQRDPSFYAEEASFKTQEQPSVASKSARSKKAKKSKKKNGMHSFHDEWGTSNPDVSARSSDGGGRQTKSFYN